MGWLTQHIYNKPLQEDWDLFVVVMDRVKSYLSTANIEGNVDDVYDRMFDSVMDKMLGSNSWYFESTIPVLVMEEMKRIPSSNLEFQISKNRWKNLKANDHMSGMDRVKDLVMDSGVLTPIEGYIMVCRYVYGFTLKAIAEAIGEDSYFVHDALDAIADKLILEMSERVDVYGGTPQKQVCEAPTIKFDARYIPGGHRRAR